jgi:hypothetical protein
MGGACNVEWGRERRVQGFGGETLGKEAHWGYSGVDERIILRGIYRKWDVRVWTVFSWFRIEKGGGHL